MDSFCYIASGAPQTSQSSDMTARGVTELGQRLDHAAQVSSDSSLGGVGVAGTQCVDDLEVLSE